MNLFLSDKARQFQNHKVHNKIGNKKDVRIKNVLQNFFLRQKPVCT